MKKLFSLIILTFMTANTAHAGPVQCFTPERQQPRFRVIDSSTVLVQGSFNEVFELRLGSCWELNYGGRRNVIAFDWGHVCVNDDMYVIDRYKNQVIDRCWILEINEYQKQAKPIL